MPNPHRRRLLLNGMSALVGLRAAFGNAALAQVNMNTIGVTASGGFVSAWADARGAGFGSAWTFTGTARPGYVQNANGVWVLRFDGVNDTSNNNAGLANVFKNVAAGFVFAVAATKSGGVSSQILNVGTGTAAGNTRAGLFRDNTAGKIRVGGRRLDADTFAALDGQGISDTTLRDDLGAFDWGGAKLQVYQGGVELAGSPVSPFQTAGSTSNTASLATVLGSTGAGALFFGGDITAVVIGVVLPSAAQLAALHTFAVSAGATA